MRHILALRLHLNQSAKEVIVQATVESVTSKIHSLSPEQLGQVDQLIDTLRIEDARALAAMSELSFATIWNDPENDVYDAL